MKRSITFHLIQWRVIPGDIEGNFVRAEELIGSADIGKGDLIILPEVFPTGFHYEALGYLADRSDEVLGWMAEIASRHGIGLAGSMPTRRPAGVANTMVLVNRVGEVLTSYDKIHLFSVTDEDRHFIPGNQTVVTSWENLKVGLAICFDLRFPEMTRKLAQEGVQIVLVSAQWPQARIDHFRDLVRVRAIENQMFMVACNSCGDDGKGLVLGGGSTVVGPSGEVMGVLGQEEGVLTVTIDVDEVERVREAFPVLKVRRKDLFGSK